MVQEAVATVKDIYAGFAAGDIRAVLERFDPEIEWVTPQTLPWSRGRYRRADGVAEYFQSFLSQLEQPRIEPDELLVCGERVVALGYESACARPTGQAFRARFAHVWTLSGGKVVRLEGIVDTATIVRAFEGDARRSAWQEQETSAA